MLQRVIGFLIVIIALVIITVSGVGIFMGQLVVDNVAASFRDTLLLTEQNLVAVEDSLELAQAALSDVNDGLDTVQTTFVDVSETISQTRPLIVQVGEITSEDVPVSIEAVQAALPAVAQAASAIDTTLLTLNNFRIDEEILGIEIKYDLGIRYDPEVTFEESVVEIGESLTGLPDELRNLEGFVAITNDNLTTIENDLKLIAADLGAINGRILEIGPLLGEYIDQVQQVQTAVQAIQADLDSQVGLVKTGLAISLIMLALTQVTSLYLGAALLAGRQLR